MTRLRVAVSPSNSPTLGEDLLVAINAAAIPFRMEGLG
jgi:hypothetical protein